MTENEDKERDPSDTVPQFESLKVRCVRADGSEKYEDRSIAVEHILSIYTDGKDYGDISCTGEDLEELCVGELFLEGFIDTYEDILNMDISADGRKACISLKKRPDPVGVKREKLKSSDDVTIKLPEKTIDPSTVFRLSEEFSRDKGIHKETGGTHSCILVCKDIKYRSEDIGRRNAINKAIGYALIKGLDFGECILYTSGRVPEDMVMNVISAGIPVLISKSVPTLQSVELSRKYGLKLICRAWPDSFDIMV
ncbi:MAG: formate dehydrogenase accessory sulfurtransferase FdhD [Lachnospiraceae bacterium]|nr:formate dehydrogenase accessory sulfurtransferase FdhD [Lachnospiraceae bacterium]